MIKSSLKGQFTATDISQEDINKILSIYGQDFIDIYTLGPGQKWILDAGKKNNSSFVMSMLFKASIPVDPAEFRRKVNEVCQRQESLRFAYAYKTLSQPYIVVLKNRTVELHFEDITALDPDRQTTFLRKAVESANNRGFDLERDPLMRITVFKLGENDHAFLFSMHHINADGSTVGLLMKEIFIDYALKIDTADMPELFTYKRYAKYLENTDKAKELSYWKEYLKGIPETIDIPGMNDSKSVCRNESETVLFTPELEEKLQNAQKAFKTTEFNVLAAAWAIMMNRICGTNDIVLGTMSSGREAGPDRNMFLAGGFAQPVPVRIRLDDQKKVSEIFKDIQTSLVISMQNPHCSTDELGKALGRKNPIFSYILNCQNFMSGSELSDVGIPGFQVLEVNLSGDMSCDLVASFTVTPAGKAIVFGYNAESFSRDTIRLYGDCFMKTLDVIADGNDICVSEAPVFDKAEFDYAKDAALLATLKKTLAIRKNQVFKTLSEEETIKLASEISIRTFSRDEEIFNETEQLNDVVISLKGVTELWREQNNGWAVPTRICKDFSILNLDAIFDDRISDNFSVVYSDECDIMFIPKETFKRLLSSNTEINMRVIAGLYRSVCTIEQLWINN